MQATIVREPKGGPDIIFIGSEELEKRLLLAGDHLSVRGFTARVVTLPKGAPTLAALSAAERDRVLSGGAPHICVAEDASLNAADAATLAAAALTRIRA